MKKYKNWNSLSEVLDAIEHTCPYIILRNYEELSDENYYMSGHDDIDILCADKKAVRKVLDVEKDVIWRSWDHCFIRINNRRVKIGIRYVKDGYYDRNWEQNMLDHRVKYQDKYYVMDDENYFYSLLYHALLQKKYLSDDYAERLKVMGMTLGFILDSESDYLNCLIKYLVDKKYVVEYPKDLNVPINYQDVPDHLRKGYLTWKMKRYLHLPIRLYGRVSKKYKR